MAKRSPNTGPRPSRGRGGKAAPREDRSKRLLDLVVMLLAARAPVPYRELRAQFKAYRTAKLQAGLRAFERDKADLLELGVPLRYVTPEDDESLEEAGYLVDLRKYRLPEIRLTADEVAALVLAGSVARAATGTSHAEVVDLALMKLAFDQPAPDGPGVPGAPGSGRGGRAKEPVVVNAARSEAMHALAERLAVVEAAIRNRKRLTLRYVTAARGDEAQRVVDPYGLVYRQGAWFLVGHCHLRGEVRTFRCDRIEEVIPAAKPKTPDFERPADFDVRRYAARSPWTFALTAPVTAVLEARPEAAAIAGEDFGEAAACEHLPGGGVRVTWPCTNPEHVVARVLAAKGALIVRSPASLRTRVRDELDRVAARYRP